uniref:Uncharacterized protein n=1 Tax=Timema cristinae TaxID=61476 RepID=A0A7R9CMV5_TIMCR|nr:unnamed protein product [Timema cristinae]
MKITPFTLYIDAPRQAGNGHPMKKINVACCVYIKYRQVCERLKINQELKLIKPRTNLIAAWLGAASCLGISMVGNFQVSNEKLIHVAGAGMRKQQEVETRRWRLGCPRCKYRVRVDVVHHLLHFHTNLCPRLQLYPSGTTSRTPGDPPLTRMLKVKKGDIGTPKFKLLVTAHHPQNSTQWGYVHYAHGVGVTRPLLPACDNDDGVSRLDEPALLAELKTKLDTLPAHNITFITTNTMTHSPNTALISSRAAALRMNEAKIMSTPCSTPNRRSDLSFSDTAGRSTGTPGRFTPFLLPREPPFSTEHTRWFEAATCAGRSISASSCKVITYTSDDKRDEPIVHVHPVARLHDLGDVVIVNIHSLSISLLSVRLICVPPPRILPRTSPETANLSGGSLGVESNGKRVDHAKLLAVVGGGFTDILDGITMVLVTPSSWLQSQRSPFRSPLLSKFICEAVGLERGQTLPREDKEELLE